MNDTVSQGDDAYVSYHDETILWRGSPSQWLNVARYLWWFTIGSVGIGLLVYWYGFGGQAQIPRLEPVILILSAALIGWAAVMITYFWVRLRCYRTIISQNRITIAIGLTALFRSERYCELSDVIDIEAPAPGIMGLVGLGTLVLRTNDPDQPVIEIEAIRNRMELRDALMPLIRRLRVERNANLMVRRAEA
jgi:membrane protein YdbS with pleckstrin-like domain